MKIQLMSDLHFEFGWEMDIIPYPDITLILAGDIDSRMHNLYRFIDLVCSNYKNVIMVAGNHDFYNGDIQDRLAIFNNWANEIDNFYFLENEICQLEDITFIGGTLWSSPNWGVFNQINDGRLTTYKGKRLNTDHLRDMNEYTTKFIKFQLKNIEGKKVVITHFGPDQALMHPKWKQYPELNTYFWADGLQDYFQYADYWFFGHTHDPTDMELEDCRCICNPNGYVWPGGAGRENWNFDKELILEI